MNSCSIRFSDIVKCSIYNFDDYSFNDKDHYIYGIFNEFDMTKCTEDEKVYYTLDNKEIRILNKRDSFVEKKLLSSLITLRGKLPTFNYIHPLDNVDNDNITCIENQILNSPNWKKYLKLILDWCKKYGMPFIGDIEYNSHFEIATDKLDYSYYGFENDFNYFLLSHSSEHKFRLGSFLIGIDIIYKTFLLAISLNKDRFLENSRDYIYDYIYFLPTVKNLENISQSDMKNMINSYIQSMRIYLKSEYNIENELTHYLYAETLLSAAMYQLLIFISYENKKVDNCVMCNKIYIRNRKDKDFCSDGCRKAYSRLSEEEKRHYKRYKKD